jgi:molecular chaperone HscB
MSAESCWKCGQASEESLFCRFCNSLQPPTPDYFAFFSLERRLSLDADDLQRRYYSLSRLIHPDRFQQRGTANEKRFALDATAILNDAYRTLRDPVARAEYVLKEEGVEAPDRASKRVPPELLEEVFEVNMSLEELRGGNSAVRPALERSLARFRGLRSEIDQELEVEFAAYDRSGDHGLLVKIRGLLDRRSYVSNLIGEVEQGLAS